MMMKEYDNKADYTTDSMLIWGERKMERYVKELQGQTLACRSKYVIVRSGIEAIDQIRKYIL